MADTSWYPAEYYIQPHYNSFPAIHFYDLEDFTRRRRKYWNDAWTRALQRWAPVGLDLKYFPRATCIEPGVTVEVLDVPPGIGAWAQFNEPPACGFIQIDVTTWQNAVKSRNIKYLTEVMTHEVGHSLGFGHGGTGIMSYLPDKTIWPNAEEIEAAKAYWF